MPVVSIEFDKKVVSSEDMQKLADASHEIISRVTDIEDVPVYANSAAVTAKIAPIEIFVRLSAQKIEDIDKLTADLKQAFSAWKQEHSFAHSINLSVIPMIWKIEINI
jgi:hypothetical protein